MFQQNGLSLDQAPPLTVVFRFFFAASLFGILAGIEILYFQTEIFNQPSAAALTLVHTMTLGVMASFMLGALFQMLPVIAGVVIQSPISKSWWVQLPMVLGTLSLLLAFNLPQYPHLYWLASLLLGSSLFAAAAMMLTNLLRLKHSTASSRGMTHALFSFLALVLLALYLTSTLGGVLGGEHYAGVREAHLSFGLFGWVALLIVSISFQVIEMFYVTPPYPKVTTAYLTVGVLLLLIVKTVLLFLSPASAAMIDILLITLFILFASLTLYRLTQRKRPLADATVWFWRMGMVSLILSMLFWTALIVTAEPILVSIASIAFAAFSLSVVFAMFYKIVPFLTWFHLNAQGYYTAPMMHEVIHPRTAKKHFWIHLAALLSLLASLFAAPMIYAAGVLTLLSFGWIAWQIVHAHLLYKKTQKSGERFDMGAGTG